MFTPLALVASMAVPTTPVLVMDSLPEANIIDLCDALHKSMTGGWRPWTTPDATICSKSWTIAMPAEGSCSPVRSPPITGMRSSETPPSETPSSTASSTLRTRSLSPGGSMRRVYDSTKGGKPIPEGTP
jgi:hypothetical protein